MKISGNPSLPKMAKNFGKKQSSENMSILFVFQVCLPWVRVIVELTIEPNMDVLAGLLIADNVKATVYYQNTHQVWTDPSNYHDTVLAPKTNKYKNVYYFTMHLYMILRCWKASSGSIIIIIITIRMQQEKAQ